MDDGYGCDCRFHCVGPKFTRADIYDGFCVLLNGFAQRWRLVIFRLMVEEGFCESETLALVQPGNGVGFSCFDHPSCPKSARPLKPLFERFSFDNV